MVFFIKVVIFCLELNVLILGFLNDICGKFLGVFGVDFFLLGVLVMFVFFRSISSFVV